MTETSSLLDFLYSDHERVASFLAQLGDAGVQKSGEQIAIKARKDAKKAGLKLGPIHGDLSQDYDWRKEIRLTYDPLWVNSRRLIDHIENNSLGNDQPIQLSQLRIFSGSLIAYDFSSINGMMNTDAMDDFIASGIADGPDHEGRSPKAKGDIKKKEAAVIREFLRALPLGIGFVLVTSECHFWFSVKREYLSLLDLDIPLKFPIHVSGTWKVLGVVDAMPLDHVEGLRNIIDREIDGLIPTFVLNMMQLIGATTALFGRPIQAHGLSPVTVYRDILS